MRGHAFLEILVLSVTVPQILTVCTHSVVVQLEMPLPPTASQTPLPEHLPPLAEPMITWSLEYLKVYHYVAMYRYQPFLVAVPPTIRQIQITMATQSTTTPIANRTWLAVVSRTPSIIIQSSQTLNAVAIN